MTTTIEAYEAARRQEHAATHNRTRRNYWKGYADALEALIETESTVEQLDERLRAVILNRLPDLDYTDPTTYRGGVRTVRRKELLEIVDFLDSTATKRSEFHL